MESADRWRTIVPLACLMAMVSGCNAPTSGANTTGHATVSPSPRPRTTNIPIDSVPGSQSKAWRDLDVTLIPPTGFAQDVHLNADVINHTGGRVDDATAKRWAVAYLRAGVWEKWGTENLQVDGFFNHLAPADSITQGGVFGDDYGFMNKAKAGGGKLHAEKLTVSRMTLIPVPTDVKDKLSDPYGYPKPIPDFAWIIQQHGPASVSLIHPDGREESLFQLPASNLDKGFIAGEPEPFAGTLGETWVIHTYLSCTTNDFLRAVCTS